jgi:hypothetical protein
MKKTMFLGFFILSGINYSLAESRVFFSSEITARSLQLLEKRMIKTINKMQPQDPRILIIDLASRGGNLQEATSFVSRMNEFASLYNVQIDTRVKSSTCESACTVMFTAGHKRYASKNSRFGFHSPQIRSGLGPDQSAEEVLEWARNMWLDAIARVDPQVSYQIINERLLYSNEMIYLKGKDLTSGFVNSLR